MRNTEAIQKNKSSCKEEYLLLLLLKLSKMTRNYHYQSFRMLELYFTQGASGAPCVKCDHGHVYLMLFQTEFFVEEFIQLFDISPLNFQGNRLSEVGLEVGALRRFPRPINLMITSFLFLLHPRDTWRIRIKCSLSSCSISPSPQRILRHPAKMMFLRDSSQSGTSPQWWPLHLQRFP